MARKSNPGGELKKGKSFQGEMPPWAELKENESVIGIYQGYKMLTIKDNETGKDKDIRVYTFQDPVDEEKQFAVSGRSLLDVSFDMAWKSLGGEEHMQGEAIGIERLADKRDGKKRTGRYILTLMES